MFDQSPSMKKLEVALLLLNRHNAGGKTGILSELLLCSGHNQDYLKGFLNSVYPCLV